MSVEDVIMAALVDELQKIAAKEFSRKLHWVKSRPAKGSERTEMPGYALPAEFKNVEPSEKTIQPGTARSEVMSRQLREAAKKQGLKIDFAPLAKKPSALRNAASALHEGLLGVGRKITDTSISRRIADAAEHLITGKHPEIRRVQALRNPPQPEKPGTTTRTIYPDPEKSALTKQLFLPKYRKDPKAHTDLFKNIFEKPPGQKASEKIPSGVDVDLGPHTETAIFKNSAFREAFLVELDKISEAFDPDKTMMFNLRTGTAGPVPGRVKYVPGAPSPAPAPKPTASAAVPPKPGLMSRVRSWFGGGAARPAPTTRSIRRSLVGATISPSGKIIPGR